MPVSLNSAKKRQRGRQFLKQNDGESILLFKDDQFHPNLCLLQTKMVTIPKVRQSQSLEALENVDPVLNDNPRWEILMTVR